MAAPHIRAAAEGDYKEIRSLIFSVLSEYGLEPAPKTTDRDLDDVAAFYKGGLFDVLVSDDGDLIGAVGLAPKGAGVGELRKMYLRPSYRGRGYGARLLKHVIARAKDLGMSRIELETATVLEEALGLYAKFGFRPVERDRTENRCDQVLALDL